MLYRADSESGYLAVHLLGLSTGTLLLPPTPSYFRKRQQELARARSPRRSAHTHDSDSESDDSTGPQRLRQTHASTVERRENDKTAIELCSYAVLWWVLLGGSKLLGIGDGVSRRLVSAPRVCRRGILLTVSAGEPAVHPLDRGV